MSINWGTGAYYDWISNGVEESYGVFYGTILEFSLVSVLRFEPGNLSPPNAKQGNIINAPKISVSLYSFISDERWSYPNT